MKSKKIVYPIIIGLAAILTIAILYIYLKPTEKDAISKPETKKQQSKTISTSTDSANSETPEVKTYKPQVITVADAGEGEKDVGIAKGGGEGELSVGPSNISLDKHENIYISDVYNGLIKKYDKNGGFIKNINPPTSPWQTIVDDENNIYVFSQGSEIFKIDQKGKTLLKYSVAGELTPINTLSIIDIRLENNIIDALVSIEADTIEGIPEGYYLVKIGTTKQPYSASKQIKSLVEGGVVEDRKIYDFEFMGKRPQRAIEIKNKNQTLLKKFKIQMNFNLLGGGGPLHLLKITKDKIFISANPVGGHTIQCYSKGGYLISQARPFGDYKKTSNGLYWETQFIEAVSDNGTIYVMDATLDVKKDAFKILKLTLK
jgi:hypothetical protein